MGMRFGQDFPVGFLRASCSQVAPLQTVILHHDNFNDPTVVVSLFDGHRWPTRRDSLLAKDLSIGLDLLESCCIIMALLADILQLVRWLTIN